MDRVRIKQDAPTILPTGELLAKADPWAGRIAKVVEIDPKTGDYLLTLSDKLHARWFSVLETEPIF